MIKHNQEGAVNSVTISLIVSIVLLVSVAVFAIWAFSSREDYKNNVDAKIRSAVAVAKTEAAAQEQINLAQQEKQPYVAYNGPQQYGSISFQYPKTWSAYVSTASTNSSSVLIDGYFMPSVLSSVSDQTANFSLRVQVLSQPYAQSLQGLQGQKGVVIRTFSLPKLPNVVGVEATGPIASAVGSSGNSATLVMMPDRTNTIQFWTDGTVSLSDFNNVVIPSFDFSP